MPVLSRSFLFAVLGCAFAQGVGAQVSVTVRDNVTGDGIPYAHIAVDQVGAVRLITATDGSGSVDLVCVPSPSRPAFVQISFVGYETLLRGIARRPRATIAAAILITAAGCAALPFFGGSFIPELKEGHFIVHMSAVPGTSIAELLRLGGLVTTALKQLPVVRSVAQRIGRAEQSDDTLGTHQGEFDVDLKPLGGEQAEFAQADIRKISIRFFKFISGKSIISI